MCIYFLLLDVTDDTIKSHGYADDGVARFTLLCNPEYILTSVESSKNVSMQVIAIVSPKWWYILSIIEDITLTLCQKQKLNI